MQTYFCQIYKLFVTSPIGTNHQLWLFQLNVGMLRAVHNLLNAISQNSGSFPFLTYFRPELRSNQEMFTSIIWDSKFTRGKLTSKPNLIQQNGGRKQALQRSCSIWRESTQNLCYIYQPLSPCKTPRPTSTLLFALCNL